MIDFLSKHCIKYIARHCQAVVVTRSITGLYSAICFLNRATETRFKGGRLNMSCLEPIKLEGRLSKQIKRMPVNAWPYFY